MPFIPPAAWPGTVHEYAYLPAFLNVTTSVADHGPGIDDFEQAMIFEKFYRGKGQRYLVRGTGMGLPIAKAIIMAQHGNISVTSQPGHGSVFSFTLPVDHSKGETR